MSDDKARLLAAMELARIHWIGVLPADLPRTDWAGYMTVKRYKRKGVDNICEYATTIEEAIEATYEAYMRMIDKEAEGGK